MCQLGPDIWSNVMGCVSVFLDEMSVFISRLSKANCPPQSAWASSNLKKACLEQKAWIRGNSPTLCWLRAEHVFFCLQTGTLPLALLGLQLANCRLCDFLASIITWVNPTGGWMGSCRKMDRSLENPNKLPLLPSLPPMVPRLWSEFCVLWHREASDL